MPASGRKTAPAGRLVLTGADKHNLNNVTLNIPVGTLTCISGPSGSGKSTLVRDCLIPAAVSYTHLDCRDFHTKEDFCTTSAALRYFCASARQLRSRSCFSIGEM